MTSITGFVRLAVAVPVLKLGDVAANVAATIEAASLSRATVTVFPELGLTGYTLGDLIEQPVVLDAAARGLLDIAAATAVLPGAFVVGLPLRVETKLANVAAVVAGGKILGVVPKSYLPNYQEFYEARWYAPAAEFSATEVSIGGQLFPFGTQLLFNFNEHPGLCLGVEICEDLWAPVPPSAILAGRGATVIANLSASNELAGKAAYRRELVVQQSARLRAAYVYASAGVGESSMDVVFSGHGLIAENGALLAESRRFVRGFQLTIADIDTEHLAFDRRRTNTFVLPNELKNTPVRVIPVAAAVPEITELKRFVNRSPFVPGAGPERDARTEEVFNLQSAALASRLEQSHIKDIVLGLSGGLDSTLAALVAVRALDELGLPRTHLKCLTLPGHATSNRTKLNAHSLATLLGASIEEIVIKDGSAAQLAELGHDGETPDTTYQNVQARYRTAILLGRANQLGGLVLGTGDLSELALGWATFNGDHISHYHVNASVPKTLVKYLVNWASEQPDFAEAQATLQDIVATPVSPELVAESPEAVTQLTEELIGPYELTDFYLYHFMRWGSEPTKILALAEAAFGSDYTREELKHWLKSFIARFFGNQWKRSVMPDGPKVGSVSLSPRGDWRMPSAVTSKMWLDELQ